MRDFTPVPELQENFELLKCRVARMLNGHAAGPVSLAFVSYSPGEGTTSVALNFAASILDEFSRRIIYLDANLKNPGLNGFLANYQKDPSAPPESPATAETDRRELVKPVWRIIRTEYNFDVVTTGRPPAAAPDDYCLTPKEIETFLRKTQNLYDVVIVDCPPLTQSGNSALIACLATGVILVVEAEHVGLEALRYGVRLLTEMRANILGVVLNKRHYPIPRLVYNFLTGGRGRE